MKSNEGSPKIEKVNPNKIPGTINSPTSIDKTVPSSTKKSYSMASNDSFDLNDIPDGDEKHAIQELSKKYSK
jgi:hypothetical protein